jgi:hypothetical protein
MHVNSFPNFAWSILYLASRRNNLTPFCISGWNFRYRQALCYTFAKRKHATALWKIHTPSEAVYAKDTFHSEKGAGYEMKVLRDGTLEFVSSFFDDGDAALAFEHTVADFGTPGSEAAEP